MTDPLPHTDREHRLAVADAAARQAAPLDDRLASITPMTAERWNSLAIDDLTEEEAASFLAAIAE